MSDRGQPARTSDIEMRDEAVLDQEDVADRLIEEELALKVAHDLVHVDCGLVATALNDVQRIDLASDSLVLRAGSDDVLASGRKPEQVSTVVLSHVQSRIGPLVESLEALVRQQRCDTCADGYTDLAFAIQQQRSIDHRPS